MSLDDKFLGKIISYNPDSDTLTIKLNFTTEDKKETLFDLFKSNKIFSFVIRKAYKETKSTAQIRTYFMLLGQILDKLDIPKDKDVIAEFDKQLLTTLFPCRFMEILGQSIPIPPSKSEMSKEDFSLLIQNILDTYSALDIKIDSY